MTAYAALIRAINVGGTGKLAMRDLVRICEDAGLQDVKTYIQSGNVVFRSRLSEAGIVSKLSPALANTLGKPVGVLVRTADELQAIIARNPFAQAPGNRVLVLFVDKAPARQALADLEIPRREEVSLQGREVFIHFPDGMGRSKLKLPLTNVGTGRNLNTVTKLAQLASALR